MQVADGAEELTGVLEMDGMGMVRMGIVRVGAGSERAGSVNSASQSSPIRRASRLPRRVFRDESTIVKWNPHNASKFREEQWKEFGLLRL
ncbi:hypothetical protein [Neorhodopirellula lusitana]|uniref:hypothetical protein n=1 Tax=Neorhodopirellula lusitana TaxID=445327 RepID=UPI0024B6628D|nr:hypothetical protein [Neorhodopirellula lusitana]